MTLLVLLKSPPSNGPNLVKQTAQTTFALTNVVTIPASVAGNTLILILTHQSTGTNTITDSSGGTWTLADDSVGSAGQYKIALYYRIGAASTTSVTITNTVSSALAASVSEWSGITGFRAAAVAAVAAGTTTPPACTVTASDGDLVIGGLAYFNASDAATVASPYALMFPTGISTTRQSSAYLAGVSAGVTGPAFTAVDTTHAYGEITAAFISSTDYTPSAGDAEGITDANTLVQTTVEAAADPEGITDAKTLVQTIVEAAADPLGMTESVSDGVGRFPADPAGITDAVSATQTLVETAADPEGLTDTAKGRTGTFYDFDDATTQTWTSQTAGAGTLAIDAGGAHDGSFGISSNVPAATVDFANLYHDIPGTTEATVSGWWRVTTEGASGSNVPFARFFNGAQRVADVYRQNVAGGANVWLRVVKAGGGANYWFIGAAYTLPLNTWVYVDFTWNVTTGVPELWIDGRQYLGAANVPTDWLAAPQIDRVYLGSQEPGNAGAWNIDQVNVSPVVPSTASYTPSAGDAEGLTDTATPVQSGARAPADTIAGSDSAAAVQGLNESLADPAGLADAPQAVQAQSKAPADTLAGSDAAQTTQTLATAAADTLAGSDSALALLGQTVSAADTLAGSDVAADTLDVARTAADAVGGTDTATPVQSLSEALADPAGITDAPTAVQSLVEAAADTLAGSDSAALAQDGQRSTADALAGTDAAAAVQALIESVADAAGLSDTLLAAADGSWTVADALGASDSASYSLVSGGVGATDSLGLTDAATAAQATARTAADPASAGDAVTTAAAAARVAADALAGSDAATGALSRSSAPADTATVSDAITIQRTYAVTVADASGMLDSASSVYTFGGVLRDLVLTLVPAENRWATRRLDPRFELNPAAARLLADAQADPYKIEPLASRWGLKGAD